MKIGRRILAVAALVAAPALLLPAAASAAKDAPTGVGISPAKVERNLSKRSVSMTVTIANNERSSRRVTMTATGLGHDLDGLPLYLDDAPEAGTVRLSTAGFTLARGARRAVRVTGEIPQGKRGLYAAVIAEFGPVGTAGNGIGARSRVASLLLLRGPKPWAESVKVAEIDLVHSGETWTITAIARNTGNVHVKPTGRARILQGDRELGEVELPSENILPAFARRLAGTWTPPASLTGLITVEVTLRDPDARASITVDLGGAGAAPPASEPDASGGSDDAAADEGGGWWRWLVLLAALALLAALGLWLRYGRGRDDDHDDGGPGRGSPHRAARPREPAGV